MRNYLFSSCKIVPLIRQCGGGLLSQSMALAVAFELYFYFLESKFDFGLVILIGL